MAVKSKKPSENDRAEYNTCIPKGNAMLPGTSKKKLEKMKSKLSGRKNVSKTLLIIIAVMKWRELSCVSEVARQMGLPRTTVNDWLIRLRDRGLDGIYDKNPPRRKTILSAAQVIMIASWLRCNPQKFGFEAPLWHSAILRKMIQDKFRIDIKLGTLRATLKRMNMSYVVVREVPHKSADKKTRQKFVKNLQRRMNRLAKKGYRFFYQDEMAMMLAAQTGRGWMPKGGRKIIKTTFSKQSLKVFGALGNDGELYLKFADSTSSKMFINFLKGLHKKYGKIALVTDNAASHKSKLVNQYLKSTNGNVILIYLPPYTPQLNPIEIQWRMIKSRLLARYFATKEELKHSIRKMIRTHEVEPVKIINLPIA